MLLFLFRSSEVALLAYFIYTAVLALILPLRPPIPALTVSLNAFILAVYALLVYAYRLRQAPVLAVIRDWLPLTLILLAYREMGWFAQPRPNFDNELAWVAWDRLLLNQWGLKAAIESFGPALPAILEGAYALVYLIGPFGMVMLYSADRPERVNRFLTTLLLGTLLSYALFPYFPSEPPRTVFPGEAFPNFDTAPRRFNWTVLAGQGMHTSVFPSAHVSGAFAAAFGLLAALPERKWAGRLLLVLAILIALATVYGRYHYAVDALAGLGVSGIAALPLLVRRLRR